MLKTGRRSRNIEDRRGRSVRRRSPRRLRMGRGLRGGGIGTIAIVLVAIYFGVDPTMLLQGGFSPAPSAQSAQPRSQAENRLADFVSVVLADTEDSWREIFARSGRVYEAPKLVLFTDAVESACGLGEAAMGPFYCPADRKMYIDLSFYRDLRERHGAPGDFAQAYVIAHEVGHHVQTLLGVSQQVHKARAGLSREQANALSVRQELQADCFAGVWANHAERSRGVLEAGDLEEALQAASSIGDDRLQQQARGHVVPETFTHGTSEQRARWFRRGFSSGDPASCDAFKTDRL